MGTGPKRGAPASRRSGRRAHRAPGGARSRRRVPLGDGACRHRHRRPPQPGRGRPGRRNDPLVARTRCLDVPTREERGRGARPPGRGGGRGAAAPPRLRSELEARLDRRGCPARRNRPQPALGLRSPHLAPDVQAQDFAAEGMGSTGKSPSPGADDESARPPQTFVWPTVEGVGAYEVELFRDEERILVARTAQPRLTLDRQWTYRGRRFTLAPGSYRWSVSAAPTERRSTETGENDCRSSARRGTLKPSRATGCIRRTLTPSRVLTGDGRSDSGNQENENA